MPQFIPETRVIANKENWILVDSIFTVSNPKRVGNVRRTW